MTIETSAESRLAGADLNSIAQDKAALQALIAKYARMAWHQSADVMCGLQDALASMCDVESGINAQLDEFAQQYGQSAASERYGDYHDLMTRSV